MLRVSNAPNAAGAEYQMTRDEAEKIIQEFVTSGGRVHATLNEHGKAHGLSDNDVISMAESIQTLEAHCGGSGRKG